MLIFETSDSEDEHFEVAFEVETMIKGYIKYGCISKWGMTRDIPSWQFWEHDSQTSSLGGFPNIE